MRPLRLTSLAAFATLLFSASGAVAQNPPPAAPAPAPATTPPAPAAEPTKSAALQRLEEQLSGLGRGQGGLTADQVAQRTLVASPTLEARKHAVEASAAGVREAKSGYVPIVNLSAVNPRPARVSAWTERAAEAETSMALPAEPEPVSYDERAGRHRA